MCFYDFLKIYNNDDILNKIVSDDISVLVINASDDEYDFY